LIPSNSLIHLNLSPFVCFENENRLCVAQVKVAREQTNFKCKTSVDSVMVNPVEEETSRNKTNEIPTVWVYIH